MLVRRLLPLVLAFACTAIPVHAETPALDLSARDTTCSPCRDFFQYANGAWVMRTEIPAAFASFGSFQELAERNRTTMYELLEEASRAATAPVGSTTGLLRTFYGGCMDSAQAEREGVKPLEPTLARIAALMSVDDIAVEVARLHQRGVGVLFAFGAVPDFKNSTQTIASTGQGGLGLPDRDYYTKEDSASVRLRTEYREHIGRLLALTGTPAAQAHTDAGRILAMETALARASMTNVQRRDPNAIYHKIKSNELRVLAPGFAWTSYFEGIGLGSLSELNVAQPEFFKALNGMLKDVPLADWKAYLRWHATDDAAPLLSSPFTSEDFAFQKVLTGTKEQLPRWKRCVARTDQLLGEALGQEYVKRAFPPEAKQRALELVKHLETAVGDRITALDWMGEATKAEARKKLAAFGTKIGYPNRWRDYSALKLEPGSFLTMVDVATEFETRRQLARVGKPVDRGEWRMTPPTVNAYYSSSNNDINFPAGILQPPFFNPSADDAVNYGGIGAVIGHEMGHGFDDRGRQFDAEGNLRDWWTADDAKAYTSRSDRIVDQFNGYAEVDTMRVNGKLTLGENIADLGGLAVAYRALQLSLAGKPRTIIDGYTPEQRFFMSWARIWRTMHRPEEARRRLATDSHSPPRWRVNGPLSNLPEFAEAFGCKAGDPMVRAKELQTRIW